LRKELPVVLMKEAIVVVRVILVVVKPSNCEAIAIRSSDKGMNQVVLGASVRFR